MTCWPLDARLGWQHLFSGPQLPDHEKPTLHCPCPHQCVPTPTVLSPSASGLLSLELAVSSAIDHIIFPIVSLGNPESNYFGDWGSQNPQHLLLVLMLVLDRDAVASWATVGPLSGHQTL